MGSIIINTILKKEIKILKIHTNWDYKILFLFYQFQINQTISNLSY